MLIKSIHYDLYFSSPEQTLIEKKLGYCHYISQLLLYSLTSVYSLV